MDIYEQIAKEHQEIDAMLQELSKGYDRQLVKSLRTSLTAHMNAEEGSLYSALEVQGREMAESAGKEHKEIRTLAGSLIKGDVEEFPSKVSKLAEALNAHFKAEEGTLNKARELFDQEKVDVLSYQFAQINRRMRESVL